MVWEIEFDPDALKELSRLDRAAQRRILRYLRDRIATTEDPCRFGRPLRREMAGLWRYRVATESYARSKKLSCACLSYA